MPNTGIKDLTTSTTHPTVIATSSSSGMYLQSTKHCPLIYIMKDVWCACFISQCFSIFEFLLGFSYIISDYDEPCSDSGYQTIGDLQDCQYAATQLNLPQSPIIFLGSSTQNDDPKGCNGFQGMGVQWHGKYLIYWNEASSGNFYQSNTRPICRTSGKNCIAIQ